MTVREEHQMVFYGASESGAEEWLCTSCTRRILLRWPPQYQRLVLDQGDTTARHTGSKGGAQVSEGAADDDRLWLWSNGIDWDGMTD